MPPKSKFTKEEIIAAALQIASESGIEAVTARSVGERLGSSARPVFTVFKNMEEVIDGVKNAARKLYNKYIQEGLTEEIRFKGVGKAYIKFAAEQPKLFQMLFMSELPVNTALNTLPVIDDNYDEIVSSITEQYGLDKDSALSIYSQLWIYTHGIASLLATKTIMFGAEEISERMTDIFIGLLTKKKREIAEASQKGKVEK